MKVPSVLHFLIWSLTNALLCLYMIRPLCWKTSKWMISNYWLLIYKLYPVQLNSQAINLIHIAWHSISSPTLKRLLRGICSPSVIYNNYQWILYISKMIYFLLQLLIQMGLSKYFGNSDSHRRDSWATFPPSSYHLIGTIPKAGKKVKQFPKEFRITCSTFCIFGKLCQC